MLHAYEIRPRKDHRGVDLISDALAFGGLWYVEASDAIDYAKFYSQSHHAVIRVYDKARGSANSFGETVQLACAQILDGFPFTLSRIPPPLLSTPQ
jgi:hypothetical protein